MPLESKIANLIKERGVNLSAISRKTGIPYTMLYDSLLNKKRERPLKASEFLAICKFLDVSPEDFTETEKSPKCWNTQDY